MKLSFICFLFLIEVSEQQFKPGCKRPTLVNGKIKIRARGKMIHFRCRKRYTRYGAKYAFCMQGTTWSHPPPLCIARGCPPISNLPNMQITESFSGAMYKFQCTVGLKRNGPELITCDGKKWSDDPPTCTASLSLKCDFEDANLCGWSQGSTDHFDWIRTAGVTPTMNTGPQFDHTFMNSSGHYMFIESSSPRNSGDMARLISPVYPARLSEMCVELWYHMLGPEGEDAVGSLAVLVKPADTDSVDGISPDFYVAGNKGERWHRGTFIVESQHNDFQLVVVGTRKDAFVSDIAIDDIRLYNCSEDTTTTVTTHPTTTKQKLSKTTMFVTSTTTPRTTSLQPSTPTSMPNSSYSKTDTTKKLNVSITSPKSKLQTSPTKYPEAKTKSTADAILNKSTFSPTTNKIANKATLPTSTVSVTSKRTNLFENSTLKANTTRARSTTASSSTSTPTKSSTASSSTSIPTKSSTASSSTSIPTKSSTASSSTSIPTKSSTASSSTSIPTKSSTASSSTSIPTKSSTASSSTSIPTKSSTASSSTSIPTKSSTASSSTSIPTKSSTASSSTSIPTKSSTATSSTSTPTKSSKGLHTPSTRFNTTTSFNTTTADFNTTGTSFNAAADISSGHTTIGSSGINSLKDDIVPRDWIPLIVGISCGIVVGMVVIGILAYTWTRHQRKKKTKELEDELMIITTADGGYYSPS